MAQYNAPFSSDSPPIQGDGIFNGIPSAITAVEDLLGLFPSVYIRALNEALEDHVTDTRKRLEHDSEYSELSEYYDVVQVTDESLSEDGIELSFGFVGLSDKLEKLVTRLEYGDANQPPRALIRRTVFKEITPITDVIGAKISYALGTGVVDA